MTSVIDLAEGELPSCEPEDLLPELVLLSSKVKNSEIVPFELGETDVDAEAPEVDLYAEISAKPGVRFVLALYGIIGPYATVAASAKLRANPLENPCWDFSIGLETELGVIVKTPSIPGFGALTFLDWNTGPLPLWDQSVASGSCDVTEEGARTPPGGGPTAEILQKPSFTPWARLTGLEAKGGDLASVLAYATGFPFITPSIDGRHVAGGGRALGVLKLAEDGATTWKTAIATSNSPLESLGSAPSGDAGLITLYRGESSSFVVVKQGQSGAASRVVGVDLPEACGATVQALATNGRGGVFVTGECPFAKSAWLVELDRELALVAASELRDSDPSAIRVIPTLLTLHDDQLVWGGQLSRTGEAAGALGFLTRLSAAGEVTRSTAFACPERLSFYPTAAIRRRRAA